MTLRYYLDEAMHLRAMNSLEKTIRLPEDWPISSLRMVHSNRKTMGLRFSAHSGLEVRCPEGFSESSALAFVHSKKNWVLRQKHRFDSQSQRFPLPPQGFAWCRGETYALRGTENRLEAGVDSTRKEIVYMKIADPQICRKRVFLWLKADLDARIAQELRQIQASGFAPFSELPKYQIRSMKSRWGSCSRNGSMRFNLALAHLNDACLRYVVCHEVAHLVHFHHGPAFHAFLELLHPDEKRGGTAVQQHAHVLVNGGVNWPNEMKKAGA